jgi:hypothetical protein
MQRRILKFQGNRAEQRHGCRPRALPSDRAARRVSQVERDFHQWPPVEIRLQLEHELVHRAENPPAVGGRHSALGHGLHLGRDLGFIDSQRPYCLADGIREASKQGLRGPSRGPAGGAARWRTRGGAQVVGRRRATAASERPGASSREGSSRILISEVRAELTATSEVQDATSHIDGCADHRAPHAHRLSADTPRVGQDGLRAA